MQSFRISNCDKVFLVEIVWVTIKDTKHANGNKNIENVENKNKLCLLKINKYWQPCQNCLSKLETLCNFSGISYNVTRRGLFQVLM